MIYPPMTFVFLVFMLPFIMFASYSNDFKDVSLLHGARSPLVEKVSQLFPGLRLRPFRNLALHHACPRRT